jgi:hypothetical protein
MDISEEHVKSIFRVEEQAKQKTSAKQVVNRVMLLRNVGWLPTDYTASYPRRHNSSQPQLREQQIL